MDPELSALLAELREILDGIDRVEGETLPPGVAEGWWECSPGDEFGAGKLAEVEAAVTKAWRGRGVTVADLVEELGKYPPAQTITADGDRSGGGWLRVDGVPVLHGRELLT